jgi:putative hydrolase of HD superfamily
MTTAMDPGTWTKRMGFILESDRLKGIVRNTLLTDQSRFENAAEHSWHVALTALVLFDAMPGDLDRLRILELLLVHDLVEIDAGDMLCYDGEQQQVQKEKERNAAERIFNLLPADQAAILLQRWLEFEARQTPEACFAHAVDRLQPLLQAIRTEGKTWRQHRIRKQQVIERMQPIRTALPSLWGYVLEMIEAATEKGHLVES